MSTPEEVKPVPKAGREAHRGECWSYREGLHSRACDDCRALWDRDKARWRCPDCRRGLIWKKKARRLHPQQVPVCPVEI